MQQAQGKDDERRNEESGTEIAELEMALRRILQLPSDVAIGTRSPAGLGLSSLGAITLQHQLQSRWAIELTVSEILGAATVDELGALIRARRSGGSATGGATSSQSGGVLI
ncbi:MAG: acyl carrier protein [Sulfurifustaceae bacterium]